MAISVKEFRQMQKDVREIKRQLARGQRDETARKPALGSRARHLSSDGERADAILRAAGLLSEPTTHEKQLVAEWQAVPRAERKRLMDEFRSLKLDKPLSQIVIENRR